MHILYLNGLSGVDRAKVYDPISLTRKPRLRELTQEAGTGLWAWVGGLSLSTLVDCSPLTQAEPQLS